MDPTQKTIALKIKWSKMVLLHLLNRILGLFCLVGVVVSLIIWKPLFLLAFACGFLASFLWFLNFKDQVVAMIKECATLEKDLVNNISTLQKEIEDDRRAREGRGNGTTA